jgi:hypothetical protein
LTADAHLDGVAECCEELKIDLRRDVADALERASERV